jgi:hypothetical protein
MEWWSRGVVEYSTPWHLGFLLVGILDGRRHSTFGALRIRVRLPPKPLGRRPIRTRDARWVRSNASCLARGGVSPNQVSSISILAAGVGAVRLEMEGKEVGAMPAIERRKNLRHILSRRARVAGSVVFGARISGKRAISDLPWSRELQSEPRGKGGTVASATKTRSDQRQSAALEYAEMREASCSRKRNSAWGILR